MGGIINGTHASECDDTLGPHSVANDGVGVRLHQGYL